MFLDIHNQNLFKFREYQRARPRDSANVTLVGGNVSKIQRRHWQIHRTATATFRANECFGACRMPFFIHSLCLSETLAVAGLWGLFVFRCQNTAGENGAVGVERLLIFVKPHSNWYRRVEAQNSRENCMPLSETERDLVDVSQTFAHFASCSGCSLMVHLPRWRSLPGVHSDIFYMCKMTFLVMLHQSWVYPFISTARSLSFQMDVFFPPLFGFSGCISFFLLSTEYHECPDLPKTALSLKGICQCDAFSRLFSHCNQSVCKLFRWCNSVSAWT